VIDAFPDADVIVASDHGAGPLKGDVNVGAWLAERGRATYGRPRRNPAVYAAWALPPPLRRLGRSVAPRMARRVMGATLAGQLGPFDWARTEAFLGFHSDLWLNLEGREPQGTVPEEKADALLEEIRAGLLDLRDPRDGAAVVAGVHRRDDLWHGTASYMAPDLMLDPWSAGFRVAPGREQASGRTFVSPPAPLAGVGEAWSSDHRPVGLFAAAGPRIARGREDELSLLDLSPTMLALLEQPVPAALDGDVARDAIAPSWLDAHPVATAGPRAPRRENGGYSDDDAAAVAAHLRDLGYIE
jgi:predicted AlkP superfamily phosphohydrolase/phosphomutase